MQELEDFLVEHVGKELGPGGVMRAVAERFPNVTGSEFAEALKRAGCRMRAMQEELELDNAEVMAAFETGDPDLIASARATPSFLVFEALLAAAERHA